ncbi:Zinc finger, RING-type [Corchorus capsularis]|uniref:RING-type E3 ubiquitin transferase n=1 Tax=Corchorus capsularis TaxID=210143 RepID=A0A1R3G5G2_COCAP|nr:Zinc finger, RING-type [Corchorus capsularis]
METTVKEIASLKAVDMIEEIDKERLDDMEAFLAWTRALETDRDLETTLMEVKYEVAVELAKILSQTIHPALGGTNAVQIINEKEDHEEEICGICQEEMVKGEQVRGMIDCSHEFHLTCLFKWVDLKTICPLCRCPMNTRHTYHF